MHYLLIFRKLYLYLKKAAKPLMPSDYKKTRYSEEQNLLSVSHPPVLHLLVFLSYPFSCSSLFFSLPLAAGPLTAIMRYEGITVKKTARL